MRCQRILCCSSGRCARDVAVEDESGEECPEYGFESDKLCHPGREEHHGQDIDVLGDLVGVAFEEPSGDAWVGI